VGPVLIVGILWLGVGLGLGEIVCVGEGVYWELLVGLVVGLFVGALVGTELGVAVGGDVGVAGIRVGKSVDDELVVK
jgi:hypothetical protein